MAIWQLNFQLIPMDESDYDEHTLLSNKSTAILSEELPPSVGWCAEDKVFGCLDTTCVEICFIDSSIDEISVRLDISSLRTKPINSIVNFAIANNLQILYNEKNYRFLWRISVVPYKVNRKKTAADKRLSFIVIDWLF